jgi:hypothetical protein
MTRVHVACGLRLVRSEVCMFWILLCIFFSVCIYQASAVTEMHHGSSLQRELCILGGSRANDSFHVLL